MIPVVLFVYNRIDKTVLTVESLLRNHGVSDHHLIIYSDGPKSSCDTDKVSAVRSYIKSISGFKTVTIRTNEYNNGLANSIINGVSEVLNEFDSVIVLEDDMLTSPYFLRYMRESLHKFKYDERVVCIHGYVYPIDTRLPEGFFLRGADCWGWATWRRGWKLFNPDGKALLKMLKRNHLVKQFDFNGSRKYSEMLESQIRGGNDSWAVRWYASAFLENKLTLYPGRSLVKNIGNDSTGTHCNTTSVYDIELSSTPIDLCNVQVHLSRVAYNAFESYFKREPHSNLRNKVKGFLIIIKRWLI